MKIVRYSNFLYLDIDGKLVWSYSFGSSFQFYHRCFESKLWSDWYHVNADECEQCKTEMPKHIKYLFLLQTLNLPASIRFLEFNKKYYTYGVTTNPPHNPQNRSGR